MRADGPLKTVADFLKAAKEQPGKLTVGASSAPGDDWFAMLMLNAAAKVETNIVPFSGDGPSWQAALAGHTDASANNLSIITARQDYTQSTINILKDGAGGLTNADMNEEGANMLMLQTRQSLGTTALSLSSQAAQSVLRLF